MMEKGDSFCKNVLEEDGQDANASIADWMGRFWQRIHEKIPTYAHTTIKKSFVFKNVSLLYDGC
jgi:hypothetical protein